MCWNDVVWNEITTLRMDNQRKVIQYPLNTLTYTNYT